MVARNDLQSLAVEHMKIYNNITERDTFHNIDASDQSKPSNLRCVLDDSCLVVGRILAQCLSGCLRYVTLSSLWTCCRYTRRRFERPHGGVVNLHTFFFQRATPHTHHTQTPREKQRKDERREREKRKEKDEDEDEDVAEDTSQYSELINY